MIEVTCSGTFLPRAARALNVYPPTPKAYAHFLTEYGEAVAHSPVSVLARELINDWANAEHNTSRRKKEAFVRNYLSTAPRPTRSLNQTWQLPDTISREESQTFARALTSAHVRVYVDAWLDTGRSSEDGSECPAQRNIWKARVAHSAELNYLANTRSTWAPGQHRAAPD
jgi:hypothetical protein